MNLDLIRLLFREIDKVFREGDLDALEWDDIADWNYLRGFLDAIDGKELELRYHRDPAHLAKEVRNRGRQKISA